MNEEEVNSKNRKVLYDFVSYCIQHPEERFWQALRNWSGADFIYQASAEDGSKMVDTFYLEGK